ncbi:MAG TPA: HAMP domain-containing sensor histidine kinase [Verrucomicrobiae bacterium]
MPPRVPLLARILVWFFLNLLLLAGVLFFFLRGEFRLEALMAGRSGERVQQMADVLVGELRNRPRGEWDGLLERFGASYGIKLLLIGPGEEQVGGEPMILPPEVRERLPRRGPPFLRPGFAEPPSLPESGPPFMDTPRSGRARGAPRLFVHTTRPDRYWIVFPAALPEAPALRGRPLSLIAVSETLSAGGLFFDYVPWLVAGGAVLALSVLWWLPFVRGITRAISQMTRATEQIAQGRFEVNAPERRRDELGQLGAAINRMAARLAGFVAGQKRFLGDVSHELCSPIARIQVALGILEQRADPKQQPYLDDLREEVQQMSQLVNELLSFSKASFGERYVQLAPVRVQDLVEGAAQRESAAATPIAIVMPGDLWVRGDAELLRRALANLVRNAVRHAGQAGPIQVTAARTGNAVVITVADHGPGVPEADLAKLFDPFYRVDSSRDRATGGVGLGLAIVKTCVESCGGTVACRNRQPSGLEVAITLPAATPPENLLGR